MDPVSCDETRETVMRIQSGPSHHNNPKASQFLLGATINTENMIPNKNSGGSMKEVKEPQTN
jgi:hypothetical protein